jgi:hypothetical protein
MRDFIIFLENKAMIFFMVMKFFTNHVDLNYKINQLFHYLHTYYSTKYVSFIIDHKTKKL